MLFKYKAVTQKRGKEQKGTIEAINQEVAVAALQRRGLVVSEIESVDNGGLALQMQLPVFNQVGIKDRVVLSRQLSNLFEAQVSAMRIFSLLAEELENDQLRLILQQVSGDIKGGLPISKALEKHPNAFSSFYVNMVKAGEESGRLDEVFTYLADYLERSYDLISKARHALFYPMLVVAVFLIIMIGMFTFVVPEITEIIVQAEQDLPIYTRVVMAISDFLVEYGVLLASGVVVAGIVFLRWITTTKGKRAWDRFKMNMPLVGDLYRKLYLSRISDNMSTMISSGISIVTGLESTADVVGNEIYREILIDSADAIRGGQTLSAAFYFHEEIPGVMTQMILVGEESGSVAEVLSTLSRFYRREFSTAVDTMIGLIEPLLIILLGLGVGILLVSILIPIYDITTTTF